MKLRQPTDCLILATLEETGRNVAMNLSYHTGKSRANINTRLPMFADYGLVQKVGPAERSGLYESTTLGEKALLHQEQYNTVDDFEALLVTGYSSSSSTPYSPVSLSGVVQSIDEL
ncbi:hypothetical protein C482_20276 [Natrialba chahannaoensis JCM 10990]|uniref:Uncharacterized protein n=1 Tax=Natrialba chahannaoensis JCM 10990 TaxID=1227492 RepID=M0A6U9_9EURY|nr:hypothetical protein [Natrialba chahannaoensis]ELY93048.1 hypothetical protein C482_20276 [Natrialba chahannaoensis JCM 10990]